MTKRLFVTPDRCIGCKSCELACAFVHAPRPGATALTRIRVYTMTAERHMPVTCLQCQEAACVKVCPTGALVRNPATGAIEVATERCILCTMCTVACPFGNIHVDAAAHEGPAGKHGTIVKCDLCEGDPACAKFCPTAALEWTAQPTKNPPPKPAQTHVPTIARA